MGAGERGYPVEQLIWKMDHGDILVFLVARLAGQ